MNAYMGFYLDGRDAKLLRHDIDENELAEQILEKGDLRGTIHAAAARSAAGPQLDRYKRQWLRDNEEEIKEAGGDADAAWKAFLDGRIDELANALEPNVLEAMEEALGDEDGDDDEEVEDEDEDDEGEDE